MGIKSFQKYDDEGGNYWCWKLSEPMKIPGLARELEKSRIRIENLNRSMTARMKNG
jgi:hypothetical protein